MRHLLEEGIFGGVGYLLIRIVGFGRIRSDYESSRILRMEGGDIIVGWFLTNLIGALFWASVVALAVFLTA